MNYPLRAIIVENEKADLELLKMVLGPYLSIIEIVKELMTYEEAKHFILSSPERIDVAFLDIELDNNYDCFELFKVVPLKEFGIIVFSTRIKEGLFENTAGKGNFLYLPKPYSNSGMEALIKKLREEVYERTQLEQQGLGPQKLFIKDKKHEYIVSQEMIIYIYIKGNVATIHYLDDKELRKIITTGGGTLTNYEEKLSRKLFIRTAGNCLVNIEYIHKIEDGKVFLKYEIKSKNKNEIDKLVPEFIPLDLTFSKKQNLLQRFLRIIRD